MVRAGGWPRGPPLAVALLLVGGGAWVGGREWVGGPSRGGPEGGSRGGLQGGMEGGSQGEVGTRGGPAWVPRAAWGDGPEWERGTHRGSLRGGPRWEGVSGPEGGPQEDIGPHGGGGAVGDHGRPTPDAWGAGHEWVGGPLGGPILRGLLGDALRPVTGGEESQAGHKGGPAWVGGPEWVRGPAWGIDTHWEWADAPPRGRTRELQGGPDGGKQAGQPPHEVPAWEGVSAWVRGPTWDGDSPEGRLAGPPKDPQGVSEGGSWAAVAPHGGPAWGPRAGVGPAWVATPPSGAPEGPRRVPRAVAAGGPQGFAPPVGGPAWGGGGAPGAGGTRRGCPAACDCGQEHALCRGGAGLPRGLPPRLATLSLVRWHLDVLAEGSFRDTPALQLLLVTAGRLGTIGDGAFAGLVLLEYLFIEDNEVGAIAPSALRGLRGLLYLSLANNGLETLPRDLFQGLETLTHLDLRGNPWRCDCRLRWLVAWLATAAATAETGTCRGPPPRNGTLLAQLHPRDFPCLAHELRPFQSLPFASLAAEPFVLGGHPGVALAQPFAGACALLEWDQLAGRFRAPTIINGSSPVACHPLQLGGALLVVVAQLGGSSAVWRRAGGPGGRFVRLQALGAGRLRRPHAVASARLGGHWFLGVADSSKAGTSTLFRWGGRGFYPHQALRPWHRDTHLEFLELGGHPALVLCSGTRRPLVYRWSGATQAFAPHTDIPHVPDVYAAKHFRLRGHVFLCLSRFLGDAKVMRWEGSMFREVQQVPARGSLVFQPLVLAGQRYVVLGNDYAPSRVYRLGPGGRLEPAQELMAPTPRAFAPLSLGHRHFLVASSFKGATQIYRHVTVDLGA